MRSEAREPARDDPEPAPDLAAEAVALMREDVSLRAQNGLLLAALAEAVGERERDCAAIDRLCSEMVVTSIREAENGGKMDELVSALREHGWAVRHAHASGVTAERERAAAAAIPRPRHARPRRVVPPGQDPLPFPRLVPRAGLAAAAVLTG